MGAEFELPSDDVAHNLYGDAIDIVRYADGEKYDLNLKRQSRAAERREAAGAVIRRIPTTPKVARSRGAAADLMTVETAHFGFPHARGTVMPSTTAKDCVAAPTKNCTRGKEMSV
jgi:hypothetical protein